MKRFTKEQFEAARAAKTPENLMAMAKEVGIGFTREQAERFLEASSGELADDALAGISGGNEPNAGDYVCTPENYEKYRDKRDPNQCPYWVTMYGGYFIRECFMCRNPHPHS